MSQQSYLRGAFIASNIIRGSVDSALLNKADRLFQNSDDSLWIEPLQNARRAGAESVEITLEAAEAGQGRTVVTVRDNGGASGRFNLRNIAICHGHHVSSGFSQT